MIRIQEVIDCNAKTKIAEKVLRELPEWFGNETALLGYISEVKDKLFYGAYQENVTIGFMSIKINNKYTAELFVTGVIKEFHRLGAGRELLKSAESYLTEKGYKFFMVKTLGESSDYEYYKRTREFYHSMGFYPLDEFTEIWDEENPCLIMVKYLEQKE